MKTMTIEELLAWAFVHELPKGGGVDGLDNANSAWRGIMASAGLIRFGELGTRVNEPRYVDHDNFLLEQGAPHDDALAVGEAVTDLARCDIVVPDGWNPLPDWPRHDGRMSRLTSEAIARAVDRFASRSPENRATHLVSLVAGTAILGREPGWDAPVPAIRMVERAGRPAWFMVKQVRDALGRPGNIEVDGFNRKAGRPYPGAYRRYEFSDEPVGDIMARLDRELWAVALHHVHERLANQLVAHHLSETSIVTRPWGEGGPGIELLARQGVRARKTA